MCVLSIKVPIRKKSGNLFKDPRTYVYGASLSLLIFSDPKSIVAPGASFII